MLKLLRERICKDESGHYRHLYQCPCGKTLKLIRYWGLRNRSCGCGPHNGPHIHRKSFTPEYYSYGAMIQRCNNPKNKDYKYYGGRGIKVLFKDFKEFFAEIGSKPGTEYTVERINNDGNYEPGNIKWATRLEQRHNRR
jgi:hypothetical protein